MRPRSRREQHAPPPILAFVLMSLMAWGSHRCPRRQTGTSRSRALRSVIHRWRHGPRLPGRRWSSTAARAPVRGLAAVPASARRQARARSTRHRRAVQGGRSNRIGASGESAGKVTAQCRQSTRSVSWRPQGLFMRRWLRWCHLVSRDPTPRGRPGRRVDQPLAPGCDHGSESWRAIAAIGTACAGPVPTCHRGAGVTIAALRAVTV